MAAKPRVARTLRTVLAVAGLLLACVLITVRAEEGLSYFTAAQQANTRHFLAALAQEIPGLQANGSGADFCAWSGVTCTSDGVSVWLDGSAADAAGELPELASDVDGSQVMVVSITLPNFASLSGTLPASWSALTRLTAIHITGSGVSGTLPAAWAAMTQLRAVMLSGNSVSGSLPAAWSALANLQYLQLENNSLTGTIPSSWAAWPVIRQVYLGGNDVTGPIPADWAATSTLAARMATVAAPLTSEGVTVPAGVNLVAAYSTLPLCSVPNCAVCISASPFYCKVCDAGYSLSMGSWCLADGTTAKPDSTPGGSSGSHVNSGSAAGGSSGSHVNSGSAAGGSSGSHANSGSAAGGSSGSHANSGSAAGGSSGSHVNSGSAAGGSSGSHVNSGSAAGGSSGSHANSGSAAGGSSHSNAGSGNPTPTPTNTTTPEPLPPCAVPHCTRCVTSSPYYCKICDAAYSLTSASFCRKPA